METRPLCGFSKFFFSPLNTDIRAHVILPNVQFLFVRIRCVSVCICAGIWSIWKSNNCRTRQQLGDNGSCYIKINAIFVSFHFGCFWLISIHESSNFDKIHQRNSIFSVWIGTLIEPSPCSHSALLTQISCFHWSNFVVFLYLMTNITYNNTYYFGLKSDDPAEVFDKESPQKLCGIESKCIKVNNVDPCRQSHIIFENNAR